MPTVKNYVRKDTGQSVLSVDADSGIVRWVDFAYNRSELIQRIVENDQDLYAVETRSFEAYISNNAFEALMKKYGAHIDWGINWHIVKYPPNMKNTVLYLVNLYFDNLGDIDYRFIGDDIAQFHYKTW
jgi:hypothetical protein